MCERVVAMSGVAVVWLALFVGGTGVAYAQQDVIITTTGERLVGEIKSVEKDILTLETAYSDSDFKIEWEDIASIESKRQFLVETFDGRRLSGSITPDPSKKPVVQIDGTSVELTQVSNVQPFERSFWARFDTALDFGYSMTRTNSAKQLSLGTNLSYRDERYASLPTSSAARRRTPPRPSDGILEMTFAASLAPVGTSTPLRIS